MLNTSAPAGKSTFWAGDSYLVHRLSKANNNYTTLEDTFPAIALDGMSFCSLSPQPVKPLDLTNTKNGSVPGFDMRNCTQYVNKNGGNSSALDFLDAFGAFWQAASVRFAREAVGEVKVVFVVDNTSSTFCPRSYFGSIELPNMNVNQVTSMHVLVATNNDNGEEKCGSGSFAVLQSMIETHFNSKVAPNFVYRCTNDPYDLTLVRCAGKAEGDETCQRLLGETAEREAADEKSRFMRNLAFLLAGVALGCLFLGFLAAALVPTILPSIRRCCGQPRRQEIQAAHDAAATPFFPLANEAP